MRDVETIERFSIFVFLMVLVGLFVVVAVRVRHISDAVDRIEHRQPCTHGESSIVVTTGKDGKLHVSRPAVTGCQP